MEAGNVSWDIIPHHVNFSRISVQDYQLVYDIIKKVKEEEFDGLGLAACQIEDELNKVRHIQAIIDTISVFIIVSQVGKRHQSIQFNL